MNQVNEEGLYNNIVELVQADKIKKIEEQINEYLSAIKELKTQKEILTNKQKEYRYKANKLAEQIKMLIEDNNLKDIISEYKKIIITNINNELKVKVLLKKHQSNDTIKS